MAAQWLSKKDMDIKDDSGLSRGILKMQTMTLDDFEELEQERPVQYEHVLSVWVFKR
jgi:hypothetical protein